MGHTASAHRLLAIASLLLAAGTACGGGGGGGGSDSPTTPPPPPPPPPDPNVVVIEVVDDRFVPDDVTIDPGDTVRWELAGMSPDHTTTEMEGTWDSGFVFRMEGDAFERTFPETEDGETFLYSCLTHAACCDMKGAVRVGASAPDPPPDY